MSVAAAINPVQASSENDVPEALLYYSSNGFLAMEHRPMDGGNYDSYSNNVPPEIVGPIKQPMQFAAVGHDKSVVVYGALSLSVVKTNGSTEKETIYLVSTLSPTVNPLDAWTNTASSKALAGAYSALAAASSADGADSVFFFSDQKMTSTAQTRAGGGTGPYLTQCKFSATKTGTFNTIGYCNPVSTSQLAAVYAQTLETMMVFYQDVYAPSGINYATTGMPGTNEISSTTTSAPLAGTPLAAMSVNPPIVVGQSKYSVYLYYISGTNQQLFRVAFDESAKIWSGAVLVQSTFTTQTGTGLAVVPYAAKQQGIVYAQTTTDNSYQPITDNLPNMSSES